MGGGRRNYLQSDLDEATDWMDFAACRTADPNLFFPEKEDDLSIVAKASVGYCADCPVREPCLEYALSQFVRGIWAGTNYRQRCHIRRKREKAAARQLNLGGSSSARADHGSVSAAAEAG